MSAPVEIGARPLSLAEWIHLARPGTRLALAPVARERIRRSRAIVADHAAGEAPIYGLNTGLGGNLGHRIPADEIAAFQHQIVRGRAVGVGPAIADDIVRAALLARLNELASGATGVSEHAIDALVAVFNAGLVPVVPSFGSIGLSDMGLVAHMIGIVIGEGEAMLAGERLPARVALARAGLSPITLEPKDGLGLISHGALTTATAGHALYALGALIEHHAVITALSFEGYRANPAIFDARLHALRPAAGQVDAAARFRSILEGSYLHDKPDGQKIQDALSFRDVAPVLGALRHALAGAITEWEIELNGVVSSPVVLLETGEMASAPNFHPASLALALDSLAIAVTHWANAAALRVTKLMTASLSGLPKYLSPVGGGSAGYVTLQKTAMSLYADIRHASAPAMLDVLPVSDTVEDMAPHTLLSARKLAGQVNALRYLAALEWVVAAQAVDLRGVTDGLAPVTGARHRALRAVVPKLREDRPPGADVEAAARLLRDEPG
jgi:histidine ammonia-lyase